MFQSFIIMFREALEAALVVGIVWSYLKRTGNTAYRNMVIGGVAAGILASIGGAFIFQALAGGFSGKGDRTAK